MPERELVAETAGEWEVVAELAVQSRDRTTRLGADRVYTVLLIQLDGSGEGRDNTLRFLGQCLRSVAPAPSTVRRLGGETLDRLATDEFDDGAMAKIAVDENLLTIVEVLDWADGKVDFAGPPPEGQEFSGGVAV